MKIITFLNSQRVYNYKLSLNTWSPIWFTVSEKFSFLKKNSKSSKFLPPTNFAVFGGHYIFRHCLQGTEILKIAQVTFLATRIEFIVMIIFESSVPGSICHIDMQPVGVFFFNSDITSVKTFWPKWDCSLEARWHSYLHSWHEALCLFLLVLLVVRFLFCRHLLAFKCHLEALLHRYNLETQQLCCLNSCSR